MTIGQLEDLKSLLVGRPIEEVQRQEFWYAGNLAEHCNGLYVRCTGVPSVRIVLDAPDLHWYEAEPIPPPPFEQCDYRLIDISEQYDGDAVRSLTLFELEPGVLALLLRFESGTVLRIENRDDTSQLVAGAV